MTISHEPVPTILAGDVPPETTYIVRGGDKFLVQDGKEYKLLPRWANYVPPGCIREGDRVVDGWPSWANYKPYDIPLSKETNDQPPANVPVKAGNPYECCGKTWNGPKQLRGHLLKADAHKHQTNKAVIK